MTIISIKEWLAAKPEDRKVLIEQGKKLSQIMYQEEVYQLEVENFTEAIDTIEYHMCEEKPYEEMINHYEWAAQIANKVYKSGVQDMFFELAPHHTDNLKLYYQMYLDEFEGK